MFKHLSNLIKLREPMIHAPLIQSRERKTSPNQPYSSMFSLVKYESHLDCIAYDLYVVLSIEIR